MAIEDEKNESAYRDYSNHVALAAFHLLAKEMPISNPRYRGIKTGFAAAIPPLHWLCEPRGAWLKVCNPKSGEDETVQVTVGAREGWKPVVTVASTSRDPVTIESAGNAPVDLAQVQKEIRKCLEKMGL